MPLILLKFGEIFFILIPTAVFHSIICCVALFKVLLCMQLSPQHTLGLTIAFFCHHVIILLFGIFFVKLIQVILYKHPPEAEEEQLIEQKLVSA